MSRRRSHHRRRTHRRRKNPGWETIGIGLALAGVAAIVWYKMKNASGTSPASPATLTTGGAAAGALPAATNPNTGSTSAILAALGLSPSGNG